MQHTSVNTWGTVMSNAVTSDAVVFDDIDTPVQGVNVDTAASEAVSLTPITVNTSPVLAVVSSLVFVWNVSSNARSRSGVHAIFKRLRQRAYSALLPHRSPV